jgi:hypothetical protein
MKNLSLALALAALFAGSAFAQTAGPGQDRSVTSAPATATQKAAAKSDRKAEGKAAVKNEAPDASPGGAGVAKSATPAERKTAAAKRKAEGAKATKAPKDPAS